MRQITSYRLAKIIICNANDRKNIINGIETNLNEWINWNMIDDVEALKNRENELKTKLSIAKEY